MNQTLTMQPVSQATQSPETNGRSVRPHSNPAQPKTRLAYLVSEYPALSHTFIEREIQALEADGFEIHVASIRRPRRSFDSDETARKNVARTKYILPNVPKISGIALARLLFSHPFALARMAGRALRLAGSQPGRSISVAAYFAEALVLLDWMRSRHIDHVHNHFGNAAGTVALIAAASGLVDFSISVHGPDIFYEVEKEWLPLKLQHARFTRAISHFCRSQLCLLTPASIWKRFSIVHCGVDPSVFQPRSEPGNAVPEILCVGRLVPAKGQHVLLEASRLLHRRGVNHRITFVGDGPDRDSLESAATEAGLEGRIRFTGGLCQPEVREEYRRADLFVLPSFAEGVPVVLMEAMVSGIPVISTTITGIPELIRDGVSGRLVPAGSVDALADAIDETLSDPRLRDRFADAGRKAVIDEFDLAESGRGMAALFRSHLDIHEPARQSVATEALPA
jgi:colanic acid/amylovoran biosynthesis glycosyltransferase